MRDLTFQGCREHDPIDPSMESMPAGIREVLDAFLAELRDAVCVNTQGTYDMVCLRLCCSFNRRLAF